MCYFLWNSLGDMPHANCDMWHVPCELWPVTSDFAKTWSWGDMWAVSCDLQLVSCQIVTWLKTRFHLEHANASCDMWHVSLNQWLVTFRNWYIVRILLMHVKAHQLKLDWFACIAALGTSWLWGPVKTVWRCTNMQCGSIHLLDSGGRNGTSRSVTVENELEQASCLYYKSACKWILF